MLDKYFIQIDRDLLERFVSAIERIAPPVASTPKKAPLPPSDDDLISLSDSDYNKLDLQAQLDDLVDTLTEKGYTDANKDELAKLTELKARLAEADLEELDGDPND